MAAPPPGFPPGPPPPHGPDGRPPPPGFPPGPPPPQGPTSPLPPGLPNDPSGEQAQPGLPGQCDPADGTLPCGYTTWSARAKQDFLWRRVSEKPYTPQTLPQTGPSSKELEQLVNTTFLALVFTHRGDETIVGRKKLVHPFGVVAKVRLEMFPSQVSDYTGLFQTGGIGLARLSWSNFNPAAVVPSMAMKILIDGKESRNFHALHDPLSQGSNQSFFLKPMSNIFPVGATKLFGIGPQTRAAALIVNEETIGKAFADCIKLLPGGLLDRPEVRSNVGLFEQASITPTGYVLSKDVRTPYKVEFMPSPALAATQIDNGDRSRDHRTVLSTIPQGTELYTVVLSRSPGSPGVTLGRVYTTSPFVSSQYGDERLHFQHASKRWR
ncbi:hypothetical protein BV898_15938 [Hypsibius exemplaris]|uniref:Uncharacterized protein n=1 Tax=Hypsibius exemplaris TaxID=2072580 RepID=A0A9X6RKZ5_HYPEX|nr:hypothetical protein BV898_15938 [Hypsibius exemplaris]